MPLSAIFQLYHGK